MTDQKTQDASSASLLNGGLAAVHCPNCPDQGWYAEQDYGTEEVMQVQCQFCYETPNSVFNIEAANARHNRRTKAERSDAFARRVDGVVRLFFHSFG